MAGDGASRRGAPWKLLELAVPAEEGKAAAGLDRDG